MMMSCLRIPKRVIFALKPCSVELGELHRVPGKLVDVGGGRGGVAKVPAQLMYTYRHLYHKPSLQKCSPYKSQAYG